MQFSDIDNMTIIIIIIITIIIQYHWDHHISGHIVLSSLLKITYQCIQQFAHPLIAMWTNVGKALLSYLVFIYHKISVFSLVMVFTGVA